MVEVLVATDSGCRVFSDSGEKETELSGRRLSAMSTEIKGTVIDGHEISRRDPHGAWTKVAATHIHLQSITSIDGMIFGGGMDEAVPVMFDVHEVRAHPTLSNIVAARPQPSGCA